MISYVYLIIHILKECGTGEAKMYHISDDKRSRESSQWIYEALEQLMTELPYEKIRITDICKKAKVGRVTFYRHYDTIDDILRKKCDDKFRALLVYLKEYSASQKMAAKTFLVPFLRFWYVNPSIIRIIFLANKDFIINESIERILAPVEKLYFEHKENSYDSYFSSVKYAVSITVLKEWFKNDMNLAPDDLSTGLLQYLKTLLNESIL